MNRVSWNDAQMPIDYWVRVYAGVLGKVIGVYLGRPFENWSHERIAEQLGEINGYVHDRLNMPLIVTDDDISGTLTFIRALEDYGCNREITPAQIGRTWLNYLIEDETVLWWGGLGNSTEHTAFLRLKHGVEAPRSGSIELNGQVVAEQIGSQIFIDGWGMVAPGEPELAAEFAKRAASVSHDGEAIYGAQVIAAMVAAAFVERDVDRVIDAGLSVIPASSKIHQLIRQVRDWHASVPEWRDARDLLDRHFGYEVYGGNCHIIPNHGLIVLALLYGAGNFDESMKIVNTAGWDTDCNAGNLGCLLGVLNGLEGLHTGYDWRGPVADRLYLPTADGGRSITDALTESVHLANIGLALHGQPPIEPKAGARFHFELPGSVQGFTVAADGDQRAHLENVEGFSVRGDRSLAVRWSDGRTPVKVITPTFIPSREVGNFFDQPGYRLLASPTIYPGQRVVARLSADPTNGGPVHVSLAIDHYGDNDGLISVHSDRCEVMPGRSVDIEWVVPSTDGQPIATIGLVIDSEGVASGSLYLDELGWSGIPDASFHRPAARVKQRDRNSSGPSMWRKAWVDGLDAQVRIADRDGWPEPYRLIQNEGRGLLMQGTREWTDYAVTITCTPHMCRLGGIAVRVQGMERYYALVLDTASTRIIRRFEGRDEVLAELSGGWNHGESCELSLAVTGSRLVASVNGAEVLRADDPDHMFMGGGIGLLVEEGRLGCESVVVGPVAHQDQTHRDE